jgi:hypothetical protein
VARTSEYKAETLEKSDKGMKHRRDTKGGGKK